MAALLKMNGVSESRFSKYYSLLVEAGIHDVQSLFDLDEDLIKEFIPGLQGIQRKIFLCAVNSYRADYGCVSI